MSLKSCCNKWALGEAEPKYPRAGVFSEVQACPTCKTRLRLTFQEAPILGDEASYSILGAELA